MTFLTYVTLILSLFVVPFFSQTFENDVNTKLSADDFFKRFKLFPTGNVNFRRLYDSNYTGKIIDMPYIPGMCTKYCRRKYEVNRNITDLEIKELRDQLIGIGTTLNRLNENCVKYCGTDAEESNISLASRKPKIQVHKAPEVSKVLCDMNSENCSKNALDKDSSTESCKSSELKKDLKEILFEVLSINETEKGKVVKLKRELEKPSVVLNLNIRFSNDLGTPDISLTQSDLDIKENIKMIIDPTLIPNLNASKLLDLLKIESPSFVDLFEVILKSVSHKPVNPSVVETLNITCEKLKMLIKRDVELNSLPLIFIKIIRQITQQYLEPQVDKGFVTKILKQVDNSFKFPRVFGYLKTVTEVPKDLEDSTLSNLLNVTENFSRKLIVRNDIQNRVLAKHYKSCLKRLIKIIKTDLEHNSVPINSIKFIIDTLVNGSYWQNKNFQESLSSDGVSREEMKHFEL